MDEIFHVLEYAVCVGTLRQRDSTESLEMRKGELVDIAWCDCLGAELQKLQVVAARAEANQAEVTLYCSYFPEARCFVGAEVGDVNVGCCAMTNEVDLHSCCEQLGFNSFQPCFLLVEDVGCQN